MFASSRCKSISPKSTLLGKMFKNLFILLGLIGFGLYLYGIVQIMDVDFNSCRMTYMFGKPQYLKLKTEQSKHPDFGLYYYYEGQPIDSHTVSFSGAPVLFVPGNGGSYKQVRSLASVALQKSLGGRERYHLDYFTIDYNEQLSGLHGGYLRNQQIFLEHCIEIIHNIYKNSKKIVLIGHSMGGKVAQSAFMHNTSLAKRINSILFIATPLDRPVVNFDPAMNEFYEITNRFLSENRGIDAAKKKSNYAGNLYDVIQFEQGKEAATADSVNNILLLSIGGGNRDLMVADSLTISRYSDVHAMTTSVPKVWLSCDHLAAVWCLQLVLVINRYLFSILSNESNFMNNKTIRLKNAKKFFGYENEEIHSDYIANLTASTGVWKEDARRFYTKSFESQRKSTFFEMVPVKDLTVKIYFEIMNMDFNSWIFGCTITNTTTTTTQCLNGVDLSNFSTHLPTDEQKRYYVVISPLKFKQISKNWTHIVIRIPPSFAQVTLHVEAYNPNGSNELILEEHLLPAPLRKHEILKTKKGKSYYKLSFARLEEPTLAFKLMVEPDRSCAKQNYITAKTSVPWALGFEQYHHKYQNGLRFKFSVPTSKPQEIDASYAAAIELFADPECSYIVSYKISYSGTLARIVHLYSQCIPAHVAFYLLLALKKQISAPFNNFENSLNILPFLSTFLQPTATVTVAVLSFAFYKIALLISTLPRPDQSPHSIIVVTILYCTSLIITLLIIVVVWLCLILAYGITRMLSVWSKLSDLCTRLLHTLGYFFPFSIVVVLLSIACYATGEFTLIFASIVYLLKIAKCIGSNRRYLNTKTKLCADQVHIHIKISLLLMLVLVIMVNLPATIAFVQYWKYRSRSSISDHTLMPSVIILVCMTLIWQFQSRSPRGNKIMGVVLYACASVCIVYCQESVYRLTYLVTFVFVVLLIQQLFSSNTLK